MVNLVWRTDVHLADRPPQSRVDNWTDAVLDKIAQVGEIAKQVNAMAVLDGGDYFHVKSPSRNSHELVGKTARVHNKYPCPVYATIGNHDCKYGSSEFLSEGPLGVLFDTGVFKPLYNEHEAVFVNNGVKVRVVGIPYHGTQYDIGRLSSLVKGDEDYLVAVAHCLASAQGGSMFENEDIFKYSDLIDFAPDVYAFGHWHKDQGVVEIAPGKWVINTGSLSRGSIAQDEDRIPKCVHLQFDKYGFSYKEFPLKVKLYADVFDHAGRERQTARSEAMEVFAGHLKESLMFREETVPVEDLIRALPDIPDEVKERALAYAERARRV